MLFFTHFRHCLQTTNRLVSVGLPATVRMFSKNKKNGVPDRWLDYRPVGQRIPGTRFVSFKVPLRCGLTRALPPDQAFGPWDLLDALRDRGQELGLIIDLTFTTRYYKLPDLPQSLMFIKIFTEGHQVPSDQTILSFKRAVRHFLRDNPDNDKLIGVHCTHGLNRTGYLVCRYLIDVDGFDPMEAVQLFNSSRGHPIERQNYLDDLQSGPRRSNEGMDRPEQEPMRGLAVTRPHCLPIGQLDGQPARAPNGRDGHEAVRHRAAPNQSWGSPRRGGANWSHHRDVHTHQPWRGETDQSHWRGGAANQSHLRGGTNQSYPRGGFNQSHPRGGGFNQSYARGGFNQSHLRGGTNQSLPWPPVAPPMPGFPQGDGLLPFPPPPLPQWTQPSHRGRPSEDERWIHPSRVGSKRDRPRDRPSPRGPSSPRGHAHHRGPPSFKQEKKSREHRTRPPGPPHPSHLPRYVPAFPPDHE